MSQQLTAEQFLDQRFDLPEAGQWAELVAGVPTCFQPPDLDHGNAILNLSKALAQFLQQVDRGYACFDLGLLLARNPDTIRFPAVSYFAGGPRFAEADKPFTAAVPELVVDMASTGDRRAQMPDRVVQYLARGVQGVWVIDSRARSVEVTLADAEPVRLTGPEPLHGGPLLAGFSVQVAALFAEPDWWR
jgi:Uma2 family endonuclease